MGLDLEDVHPWVATRMFLVEDLINRTLFNNFYERHNFYRRIQLARRRLYYISNVSKNTITESHQFTD